MNMDGLIFTYKTEKDFQNACLTGQAYCDLYDMVRFVVKHIDGGTIDFPVKTREEALKLSVDFTNRGIKILDVYQTKHMEEDKWMYDDYR